MTLLWFLLGLALVVSIARYNESNRLFWALFCSLLIGVAGGHLVSKCTATEHKENKENLIQVCPTHGLVQLSDITSLADTLNITTQSKTNRVSKEYTLGGHEVTLICKSCKKPLTQPPQVNNTFNKLLQCYLNTSTHLDSEK